MFIFLWLLHYGLGADTDYCIAKVVVCALVPWSSLCDTSTLRLASRQSPVAGDANVTLQVPCYYFALFNPFSRDRGGTQDNRTTNTTGYFLLLASPCCRTGIIIIMYQQGYASAISNRSAIKPNLSGVPVTSEVTFAQMTWGVSPQLETPKLQRHNS